MDLITDDEVAALLGVTVDAQITALTAAVNADFLRGTARTFERMSRTVVCRGFGPRMDFIYLPEAPIFEVTEVRIDPTGEFGAGTAIADLSKFHFETDEAAREFDFRLFWSGGQFPEGARVAQVTFDAGYYAADDEDEDHLPRVPDDLRREMIVEAAKRVRRGAGEEYESASLGDFSYTRRGESESEYRRMIRRYRRP